MNQGKHAVPSMQKVRNAKSRKKGALGRMLTLAACPAGSVRGDALLVQLNAYIEAV
jgi:hypothetical protein